MLQVNIINLRHRENLTQTGFAESIFVTKGSLQAYETGRANPPLKVIKRIIDTYNIIDAYSFLFEYYDQWNIDIN